MLNKLWVAMFSQTGSEIINLSRELGHWPNILLTDNRKFKAPDDMPETTSVLRMSSKGINEWLMGSTIDDELGDVWSNLRVGCLVTAHGYLRIIPGEVIDYIYETYHIRIINGHPALFSKYPELKGKDPQKRVAEGINKGLYKLMGSIVHEMSAEVDSGKVLVEVTQGVPKVPMTESEVFEVQYKLSHASWASYLKKQLEV